MSGWIQTYSGVAFYPLDPRKDDIRIEDIAHALSLQCRFTGHCRRFYSVAEHSLAVSMLLEPSYALWGLLHDASEAYLCDVARPVKHVPDMEPYRRAELRLQTMIYERFGLLGPEPHDVHLADQVMLGIEARELLSPLLPGWEQVVAAADQVMPGGRLPDPLLPREAEALFLARFRQLTTSESRPVVTVAEAAAILGRHAAKRRRAAKSGRDSESLLRFAEGE